MKDAGKSYGHLVYFTAIAYNLLPSGIFCGHFGNFSRFGMLYQDKSGNPGRVLAGSLTKWRIYNSSCEIERKRLFLARYMTGAAKKGISLLCSGPGMPDGIFSNEKSKFGKILEGLAMEDVGIFYAHLKYLIAIWYILWPFGPICCHFGIFFPVVVYCTKKNLATLLRTG
jgi:hypothetical protein